MPKKDPTDASAEARRRFYERSRKLWEAGNDRRGTPLAECTESHYDAYVAGCLDAAVYEKELFGEDK